jgi:oligopeptidase B
MNQRSVLSILLIMIFGFLISGCTESPKKETMKAPVAKIEPKELKMFGNTRIDNYYWLNQRENPDVVKYLEDENAYTKTMMANTDSLQADLYKEMVARIKQTDMSVPYFENGYFYYTRFEEGKEYPVYCRKKGSIEGSEDVMLDVNMLAQGLSYCQVGGMDVSEDNRLLSYSVDTVSRRIYTIYFKNLETGELLPDKISNASGNLCWASDNKTLFYSTKDESLREDKIWRHVLGTDQTADVMVFNETDETFSTFIYKSKSKKYLIIGSSSTLTDEYRILDSSKPLGEFTIFQPRQRDIKYDIAHYDDRFYIRTNYQARNFRLMECPLGKTSIENWKEVIPHREDVLLEAFDVFKGYLAIQERKNGMKTIRIFNGKDLDFYMDFNEQAYTVNLDNNPEFETEIVRYNYTSLTTPMSVYDYNIKTKESKLLKRQEVVGGYNPDEYFTERMNATASDGTLIPISIVYKKGIKKDGNNPLLLYGYGSYGYSTDPYFSSVRLSLLDRGFIYAIAHIRGGEEMGRQWYEDGKLLKKMNTFNDFNACAEFLIQQNFTKPEKLYAMGGSAGGLLMGAVINLRPDLYHGVIAAVPFVDVVTTMLDESIPLTTGEYDEWGNPNDSTYYFYMLSYSPYDNVKPMEYPALLVTTGLHDSQVQYWEPAKWVAKLRVTKKDTNPLYLWTNMDYGHGGASGRFQRYKEIALEYAFLLDLEGIQK